MIAEIKLRLPCDFFFIFLQRILVCRFWPLFLVHCPKGTDLELHFFLLHVIEIPFDVTDDLNNVFARGLGALGALAGSESLHVLEEILHLHGRLGLFGRSCRG